MKLRYLGTSTSAALALLLSVSAPLETGCAQLLSALPAATAVVVEAAQILDTISSWVSAWFRAHPDEAAEKKTQFALAKVRSAMNAYLRIAEAKERADDKDMVAAFDALDKAYHELLELVRPYGIKPTQAVGATAMMGMSATEPSLEVPMSLRRPR